LSQHIEVVIEDLAFDGKAVAHLDGKVVFLNGGLPGETVRAEITRSKPRYYQATVHEILTRSDLRIPARCSHFDYCGGCTWQDLEYQTQLQFKTTHVRECIARIGGLEGVNVHDVIGANEVFRYRNKMEFSFHVMDEKDPDSGEFVPHDFHLGLHHRGRYDEVFDLEHCHLQSERANDIVNWVRDFVRSNNVPVYNIHTHEGYMRFLVIRETHFTDQVMVFVVTNFGDMPSQDEFVRGLTETFPFITTIVHGQNGKKANVAQPEAEQTLFGPGYIEDELLGLRFRICANSFFQTNPAQAEVLYRTALEMLEPESSDRLLDLYCGTGAIGLLMASRVGQVYGVELVAEAVQIAGQNAEINKIDDIRFFEANVKDFLAEMPADEREFDIIVIDPPRAGLHPKALKRVIEMRPAKLLYISCNPATFARDAKTLVAAGYELPEVKPVDMFPHTRHIELVGLFSV